MNKEVAIEELKKLVNKYQAEKDSISKKTSIYNETQLRNDFLNPLIKILGWDIYNEKALPQHLREVVHEANVNVEENNALVPKSPDYAFRIGVSVVFFLEAKKPSVSIETDNKPSFQARRYGWNGRHKISVLSNFDKLIIFDCRYPPSQDESSQVARLKAFSYEDYVERFEEIYSLISRDAVLRGSLDNLVVDSSVDYERLSFDSLFLRQIEHWRQLIAINLVENNHNLNYKEINFLVQRLINRVLFLRVCEDRHLEKYEQLKNINDYESLKKLFLEADLKYNSGLFDFLEDKISLGISINPEVLISIFSELYFPQSPYDFSVVDANILGEIYDQFLGREIVFNNETSELVVVDKPEVVASNGVVPTPKFVVDEIVRKTLDALFQDLTIERAKQIRVCDLCCGSGVFLVSAFTYISNWYIQKYLEDASKYTHEIYQDFGGTWKLTISEKQRILLSHIYGVDIDSQAVEVARFSLLLKMLEDEKVDNLQANLSNGMRALPNLNENIKCGNSLVDSKYFDLFPDDLNQQLFVEIINPFDWNDEFPQIMSDGGFDAIVGNPPYVRIQNMMHYSEKEVEYYRSSIANYQTIFRKNFDKYYLFIERSINLLKDNGRLGCIVPNKFLTIVTGTHLRAFISGGNYLSEITHFGVQQVFPKRSTYTSIVILDKSGKESFTVSRVDNLNFIRTGEASPQTTYSASDFADNPWVFIGEKAQKVFRKLQSLPFLRLDEVADIFVGLQTSADKIYIIKDKDIQGVEDGIVTFLKSGRRWEIEQEILSSCLYDATLSPFAQVQSNAKIIFPYRVVDGQANLYTRKELKENYPKCWNYLLAHRESLESRDISGGDNVQWYQYGRSQSLTKFDGQPKLIWSVLSRQAPYAIDENNVMFTGGGNGPYYSLRVTEGRQESLLFILAVISHPIFEAWVKVKSSMFREEYYSHGKQFLQDVPLLSLSAMNGAKLRIYNEVVQNTKLLINLNSDLQKEGVSQKINLLKRQKNILLQKITNSISALYELDQNDLDSVLRENLYFTSSPEGE